MSNIAFQIKSSPDPQTIRQRLTAADRAKTQAQRQVIDRQARRFAAFAFIEAPKKTGRYAREITTRNITGPDMAGFEVLSPGPLGTFIQKGTRPHVIRAKNAPMLRFYWPKVGRVVYFKSVNHPGTKPNRFYNRALQNWLPGAKADLSSIANAWTITMRGGQ
jgi:hypothetical protein